MENLKRITEQWLVSGVIDAYEYINPELASYLGKSILELTQESLKKLVIRNWKIIRSPTEFLAGQLAFYVPGSWNFENGNIISENGDARQSVLWANKNDLASFFPDIDANYEIMAVYCKTEESEEQGNLPCMVVIWRQKKEVVYHLRGIYGAHENLIIINASTSTSLLLENQLFSLVKTSPWSLWGWE